MDAGSLAMPGPRVRSRRPRPPAHANEPRVSNARIAMIVLIAAESMLFAGLIGTYLVFRLGAASWPPPGLPRLPLGLTVLNTAVLLASVVPMHRALRALRQPFDRGVARHVEMTALLGAVFLAVQGTEWARLVAHGLTLSSGPYGATFYVLIGCHGLHVLAAVVWLAVVAFVARRDRIAVTRPAALEMCGIYWYFVCALWVVLFPLVYLY
jgi:heme/copper-type cytochrome/quinol oxidase subunit 3